MAQQLYVIETVTLSAGEVRTFPGTFSYVGCYSMTTLNGVILASLASRQDSGSQHRFALDSGLYFGPSDFDEVTLENPGGVPVTFQLIRSQAAITDNRLVISSASVLHVDSTQLPAALAANGGMKTSLLDSLAAPINTDDKMSYEAVTNWGTSTGGTTGTFVAAGTNVNGVRLYGVSLRAKGDGAADGFAQLIINAQTFIYVACHIDDYHGFVMEKGILVPSGLAIGWNTSTKSRVSCSWKVL